MGLYGIWLMRGMNGWLETNPFQPPTSLRLARSLCGLFWKSRSRSPTRMTNQKGKGKSNGKEKSNGKGKSNGKDKSNGKGNGKGRSRPPAGMTTPKRQLGEVSILGLVFWLWSWRQGRRLGWFLEFWE